MEPLVSIDQASNYCRDPFLAFLPSLRRGLGGCSATRLDARIGMLLGPPAAAQRVIDGDTIDGGGHSLAPYGASTPAGAK